MQPLFGIFVGGKSSRMGGAPKGLLRAPDQNTALVVRAARLGERIGCEPVFVGAAEAYRKVLPGLREIADQPFGIGPLGGLGGLLRAARGARALAIACDMPYLTEALLGRVLHEEPNAAVHAPRGNAGLWEPLCARYQPEIVIPVLDTLLAEGVRSFQALFAHLPVCELYVTASERNALRDWDTPRDVEKSDINGSDDF